LAGLFAAAGGVGHACLALFDFGAAGFVADFRAGFAVAVFAARLGESLLGVARCFFVVRVPVPAPALSSIKRIASSSEIVSADEPFFKVALILP
jgi:hypothetical protein